MADIPHPRTELYPEIEPYSTGTLKLDGLHTIYWEQAGNPDGEPVLQWGPGGMQQLSEVRKGRFEIMGFAGNSGPDHIDQFHGMPEFLRRTEQK